jgi:hypothetical protein
LITLRYPTRGTEFLRIEFHRTNYGLYEPITGAMRQFNEVIGLFDFNPRSVFESSKADFVDLSNSSLIFREYCALPCYFVLSFSTVNVLS